MEDILDKKTIIINGSNTSNITVDIEPIKNVCSIKLVEMYINRTTNTDESNNIKNIYLCINDYGLKTLYDNTNYKSGINIFSNVVFDRNYLSSSIANFNNTGIVSNFNLDTENYVFNPIQGELNKLNISFKEYNESNTLVDFTTPSFSLELCIYSKRMKLTMF